MYRYFRTSYSDKRRFMPITQLANLKFVRWLKFKYLCRQRLVGKSKQYYKKLTGSITSFKSIDQSNKDTPLMLIYSDKSSMVEMGLIAQLHKSLIPENQFQKRKKKANNK